MSYKRVDIMEDYEEKVVECKKNIRKMITKMGEGESIQCPNCNVFDEIKIERSMGNETYSTTNPSMIYAPVDKSDPNTHLVAFDWKYYFKCNNCGFECHDTEKVVLKNEV
jgi:DNA-directed RNA polymerase subunit RPC12/RpoP